MLFKDQKLVFAKSCNQKTQTGHLYEHILISAFEDYLENIGFCRDSDYEMSGITFEQNSIVLFEVKKFNKRFDLEKIAEKLSKIKLNFSDDNLRKHIKIIKLEEDFDLYIGDFAEIRQDLRDIHRNKWLSNSFNLPFVDNHEKDSEFYLIDKPPRIQKSEIYIYLKETGNFKDGLSYILGNFLSMKIGREVARKVDGYFYSVKFNKERGVYAIKILAEDIVVEESLVCDIFNKTLDQYVNQENLEFLLKRTNDIDFYEDMICDIGGLHIPKFEDFKRLNIDEFRKNIDVDFF